MDRFLATKREDVGLIVRAISFQDFQPMWSQNTNVTDRQTDGRTDGRHAIPIPRICTKVHCAVKTHKENSHTQWYDLTSEDAEVWEHNHKAPPPLMDSAHSPKPVPTSTTLNELMFRKCLNCNVTADNLLQCTPGIRRTVLYFSGCCGTWTHACMWETDLCSSRPVGEVFFSLSSTCSPHSSTSSNFDLWSSYYQLVTTY